MRTCVWCKEEKDIDAFGIHSQAKSGRHSTCKECRKKRYFSTPEQKQRKAEYKLMRQYGLSQEQYNVLLASQGGGCAICGKTPEENGKALAVDHDHSCCPGRTTCGKCVRGLLCSADNQVLGFVNDDTARLRKAIDYLNNHKPESEGY